MKVLVKVRFDSSDRDGFPDPDASRKLSDLEDHLLDGLGAACLVAVVTAAACRDYTLYADPSTKIEEWASRLRVEYDDQLIDVAVAHEPGKETYVRLRRQAEPADGDRQVIAQLVAHGANLDEEREIDYYLDFRIEAHAADAARVLAQHGYLASVFESPDGNDWSVLVTMIERARPERIAHYRSVFERFADDREGTFDGWSTSV